MDENIKNIPKEAVVDASFCLAFLFPDESSSVVDKVFESYQKGGIKLLSSPLLPYEVLNGIRSCLLRKRIAESRAKKLGSSFIMLEIPYGKIDFKKTFQLCLKHNISFYDATYLFLSKAKKLPLFTFDKDLSKLAKN